MSGPFANQNDSLQIIITSWSDATTSPLSQVFSLKDAPTTQQIGGGYGDEYGDDAYGGSVTTTVDNHTNWAVFATK